MNIISSKVTYLAHNLLSKSKEMFLHGEKYRGDNIYFEDLKFSRALFCQQNCFRFWLNFSIHNVLSVSTYVWEKPLACMWSTYDLAAYLRKLWSPNAHSLRRCKVKFYIGQIKEVEIQLFHSGNDTFHEWYTYIIRC